MGTWGTGVMEDDYAKDIESEYISRLYHKKTNEEATEELIKLFQPDDDDTVFWLVLASRQWDLGRTLDMVLDKALDIIDSGQDLVYWNNQGEDTCSERMEELIKLRIKLQSAPPNKKRITKPYWSWKSPFSVGDVVIFNYNNILDMKTDDDLYGFFKVLKINSSISSGFIVESLNIVFYLYCDSRIPQKEEFGTLPYYSEVIEFYLKNKIVKKEVFVNNIAFTNKSVREDNLKLHFHDGDYSEYTSPTIQEQINKPTSGEFFSAVRNLYQKMNS